MSAGGDILSTAVAHQWQCDHFGHLNVRNHAALFDDAIFIFWGRHKPFMGDELVPVTAEFRMSFKEEVLAGTIVATRAEVTRLGTKSVSLTFSATELQTRKPLASCEVIEVFMDRVSRQSAPIPAALREQLLSKGVQ